MTISWPGRVPAGKVENGIVSGLDWFPTLVAAGGNPNIADELKQGKQIGDRTYHVHLDGYDQTDLITGKGKSKNEIWYFTEGTLSAARIGDYKFRFTDQPNGWFGHLIRDCRILARSAGPPPQLRIRNLISFDHERHRLAMRRPDVQPFVITGINVDRFEQGIERVEPELRVLERPKGVHFDQQKFGL